MSAQSIEPQPAPDPSSSIACGDSRAPVASPGLTASGGHSSADEELIRRLRRQLRGTISLLVGLIEDRQERYVRHANRVAKLAHGVGVGFGLDADALDDLKTAALIHDVGLLRLPMLHVGSRWYLPPEERRLFETHPEVGAELAMQVGLHPRVHAAVRTHHERCDGTGYPNGLTAEETPLEGRILAACDAFDALTHPRSEIDPIGLTATEALARMRELPGAESDIEIAEALGAFLETEAELAALTGTLR